MLQECQFSPVHVHESDLHNKGHIIKHGCNPDDVVNPFKAGQVAHPSSAVVDTLGPLTQGQLQTPNSDSDLC